MNATDLKRSRSRALRAARAEQATQRVLTQRAAQEFVNTQAEHFSNRLLELLDEFGAHPQFALELTHQVELHLRRDWIDV